MNIRLTGEWDNGVRLLDTAKTRITKAMIYALRKEARFLRKEMAKGITSQTPGGKRFKPLKETTLKARRAKEIKGRKALVASGELRKAIKVVQSGRDFFVGVPRAIKHEGGPLAMYIAQVHEYGTSDGRIPARPFIGPVVESWLPEAKSRVEFHISEKLRRDYGTAPPIRNK